MTGTQSGWWLTTSPEEVAARILPLFATAPFAPYMDENAATSEIVAWCKTGRQAQKKLFPVIRAPFEDPDTWAIAEAIQVLEHTRLVMRYFTIERTYIGLTRRGMQTLASDTVRRHLGLETIT